MRSDEPQSTVRSTPERARHGPIELLPRPIKARPGEYAAPEIALDILASMHARGAITQDQRIAGQRFHDWFRLAQLDPLRSADVGRIKVDGGSSAHEISAAGERGRREIAKAIRWVGGQSSSQGKCLWHVIGLEESVREWARSRPQSTSNLNAAGIIAVTLERLALMPWTGPGEKTS